MLESFHVFFFKCVYMNRCLHVCVSTCKMCFLGGGRGGVTRTGIQSQGSWAHRVIVKSKKKKKKGENKNEYLVHGARLDYYISYGNPRRLRAGMIIADYREIQDWAQNSCSGSGSRSSPMFSPLIGPPPLSPPKSSTHSLPKRSAAATPVTACRVPQIPRSRSISLSCPSHATLVQAYELDHTYWSQYLICLNPINAAPGSCADHIHHISR